MKAGDGSSPTRVLDIERPGLVGPGGGGATVHEKAPTGSMRVPALASGVTLLGELDQSGFEDPPSLVRRGDGQVVQVTDLLYITLQAVDGERDLEGIAAFVSERLQRRATAENVEFLLEEKLRPLGLLKNPDGSEPAVKKSNPLLGLRWKVVVSGERLTNRLTAPFAVLFRAPIVALAVAGFVAVCGWVLLVRGVGQGTRQALQSPGLLLMVFGLTVLSAGFHEFGHAAACRFSGGQPGAMGAGIYLVWPAFYTDVTDSYRLSRSGRLRTALGGLYFNAIFILITFGAWRATGSEVFLLFVPIQLFQMLHQLLPVVRMDGYYILSDLTGVPDLFARIKPTLKSAVPGKETDEQALPLKRWVRVTVTAWVLVVVPLLLASVLLAALALPRMVATASESFDDRWDVISAHASEGSWLSVVSGGLAMVALLIPLAGTGYLLARLTRRIVTKGWAVTSDRPVWRALAVTGTGAAVVALAWMWWPNGEYKPISPKERGTLTEVVAAVTHVDSGRPSLTEERELELQTDFESEPGSMVAPEEDDAPPTTAVDSPPTTTHGLTTSTTIVRSTPTTSPASTATTLGGEPDPDFQGE